MYAVLETGGKQYKVSEGDVIYVEKLQGEAGDEVTFSNVLAVGGDKISAGKPYVEGASVTGKIVKQGKGKKITVFTYRPKKNSKRKMGHRQLFTKVEIESIKA
ncbi:MAG: 50S ribosomal protein L21 [Oscillospiraceae bacterium]|jgi:large subunit ribosomal protein L21